MEVVSSFIMFCVGVALGKYRQHKQENTGEALVRRLFHEKLNNDIYHVLNDVTLPIGKETTQIDHVVISTKGIFVIETKHYSGWIFGDKNSKVWTQTIFKKKSKFQNPIRQNYKHVKALQDLFDFMPTEYVYSMIVFTGEAEFKTRKPEGVYFINECISKIQSYPDEVISLNRLQFCVGRLEYFRCLISEQTDIEHTKRLNDKFGKLKS